MRAVLVAVLVAALLASSASSADAAQRPCKRIAYIDEHGRTFSPCAAPAPPTADAIIALVCAAIARRWEA